MPVSEPSAPRFWKIDLPLVLFEITVTDRAIEKFADACREERDEETLEEYFEPDPNPDVLGIRRCMQYWAPEVGLEIDAEVRRRLDDPERAARLAAGRA